MENDVQRAAEKDDRRELFASVSKHSVDIASLKSGLESLASSTESGFRNLSSQIESIGQQFTSSRPQLGVIATILISACALVGALVGFALKSSIIPLERDTTHNQAMIQAQGVEIQKDMALITAPIVRRIEDLERRLHNRISDSDDAQDVAIREMQKIIDLIVASSLEDHLNATRSHKTPP